MVYTIHNLVIIDGIIIFVIVSKYVIPCAWFKGDDIGGQWQPKRDIKKLPPFKGNIKGGFLPPFYYLNNFNLGLPKGFNFFLVP